LQAGHPLFSPAALALVSSTSSTTEAPLLSLLLDGLKSTKFFVHYASAEVFTSESEFFVSLLRAAGVQVDSVVEVGGWHCCQTIFPPLESDSVLARWFGLGQRERRACETFAKFIKTG
jgi:acetyl esterase/lipase